MIAVEGVSHSFVRPDGERTRVLAGVDLTVPDGRVVSILGPTGCGKTTLLRIIHGLTRPSEGRVLVDGQAVTAPAPDRAMVFQEFNLLPWRTARRNVEFGLELRGVSRSDRRVRGEAALAMVGLMPFAEHYPHELSGGMKQRLGLARALCTGPRYLLMDEPLGALDLHTRELMQRELLGLLERDRRTALVVTHSVDEAILLSDQIVVLSARPARVLARIDVDLPRPRADSWRTLRSASAFDRHRQVIWDLIDESHDLPRVAEVGVWS